MRPIHIIKYVGFPAVGLGLIYSLCLLLYPPGAAAVLALLGRSPDCGVSGTVAASHRLYRKYPKLSADISSAALVLKQDAELGLQLVQTSKGAFWEPKVEGSAVTAQLAEIETKYDGFREPAIRPGDVVLDCGANVGVFTREAVARGARLVVAIEPAPVNLECLRRNFADEISSGKVIVYPKGVWEKEEMLRLRENESTSAMDSFVEQKGTREGPLLPLTTIDILVRELKLDRVDFVKMDIEGAERRALIGGLQTLSRYRPRLEISVNHLPDDPAVVPGIVKRAWSGYRAQCLLCSLQPMKWRAEAGIFFFRP
jgi:FkbM family methyltransferase